MRVFVMGAGGYIGNAVAKAFRSKGHTVFGLVRKPEDGVELSKHEIWPIMGDLHTPQTFQQVLDDVEVAVNCAFDPSSDGVERDAIVNELVTIRFGRSRLPRTYIYTSGVWAYGSRGKQIVDEASPVKPIDIVAWRPSHEQKVISATGGNLRTVVMRPGVVYGHGGGMLTPFYEGAQNGAVPYVDDGQNCWPLIHVEDLAHAYVSAAEKEVSGVILNVVDDSNTTTKEIAEAVAAAAGIPGKVKSVSADEWAKGNKALAQGYAIDLRVNNSRIKRLLHWQIHHAPLIVEAKNYYFAWQAGKMKPSLR